MPDAAKKTIAPLYLFACLILGGSAQGAWQNVILQLGGIAIIAWAAGEQGEAPLPRPAGLLLYLAAAAIALVALQLIPLPPAVWAHGIRARLADGYRLLGEPVPWLPLSLAPYETLASLLRVIPPLATFCAVIRLSATRPKWLAVALLAGAAAGVILGIMQVAGGGATSTWYPYAETNLGLAVGFFANANHMASLLLISLPFLAAIAAQSERQDKWRRLALNIALVGSALVLTVGIALNGSLAGYALLVPVIAASALIVLPRRNFMRRIAIALAVLSVIAAIVLLARSDIGSIKISHDARTSVQSREAILETSGKAIFDFLPLGSGLGSFREVYRLYERPDSVTPEYVIHAHNDYVEMALELGLGGILLIILFLAWWSAAVMAVWRRRDGGPFAQAASISSAAILVHSLVDFPLRTSAIAACFAMCLALLADRRSPLRRDIVQLRQVRHVVFE